MDHTAINIKSLKYLVIIGDWNASVGSQEIPGISRQVWPWSTK